MTTVDLIDTKGTKSGTVELPAEIFDVQTNVPLIHQVVVAQLAAARQGTHSTKTRGLVRGGGRKPYKQKGTGRARQGSTRAPQFAGGGVVHGPHPRDYSQRTPKKMKAAALRGALSDRARFGRVHVLTGIVEGQAPSTKDASALLGGLSERRNLLVVIERGDEVSLKSVRNLADVHVLTADQLNTYDVLCSDDVVFTQAALEAFLVAAAKSVPKRAAAAASGQDVVADAAPAAKVAKAAKKSSEPVIADAVEVADAAPVAEAVEVADAAPVDEVATVASAFVDADLASDGGFGADSAAALTDGSAPEGFAVKGNKDSLKYHVPGSRWYDATVAEVWFRTADAAAAAGFEPAGGATAQQGQEEDQ